MAPCCVVQGGSGSELVRLDHELEGALGAESLWEVEVRVRNEDGDAEFGLIRI